MSQSATSRPLNEDIDAARWAREFKAVNGDTAKIDDGLLLGWFANAIMAGYDRAQRTHSAVSEREPFWGVTGPLHVVCQCDKCKAAVSAIEDMTTRNDIIEECAQVAVARSVSWRQQHPLVTGIESEHARGQLQRAEEADVIAADIRFLKEPKVMA